MRLAMIQTKGFHATGTITPEDVAANLDAIMDTTDAPIRDLENPPL